jgi:hypothetical protein
MFTLLIVILILILIFVGGPSQWQGQERTGELCLGLATRTIKCKGFWVLLRNPVVQRVQSITTLTKLHLSAAVGRPVPLLGVQSHPEEEKHAWAELQLVSGRTLQKCLHAAGSHPDFSAAVQQHPRRSEGVGCAQ